MRAPGSHVTRRRTPTVFEFVGVRLGSDRRTITCVYRQHFRGSPPLAFSEKLLLPRPATRSLPRGLLAALLRDIQLVLGLSYYKLYCAPRIRLSTSLTETQATFWSTLYRRGLGEFLYRNTLDPKHVAVFPARARSERRVGWTLRQRDRALVGVGGGKDSIVVSELLKTEHYPHAGFVVETQRSSPLIQSVCSALGIPSLRIRRTLDAQLFSPPDDAYAGHIPISAITAFVGILAAAIYDYRYVVVGNEQSSNVENITYKGERINHQWSKSSECEELIQSYVRRHLTPDVTYFSLLRPLYEIRVAELFSKLPKYFDLFSSCNRNFVVRGRPGGRWCGECPKCAFVFLLLVAFLPRRRVIKMFGRDLLADERLVPLYRDLLGFGKMKPFDCVGTFEESRAALRRAAPRFRDAPVVKEFLRRIPNTPDLAKVFRTQPAPAVPPRFIFLGMKDVLLLGYGKEGRATKAFLRRTYPRLRIGIADATQGKHYLDTQADYDLAVRTPGMPRHLVRIHATTAMNIFFSRIPNRVVGVTGTKGKSTTSALIAALLKSGGHRVELVGNIGRPALELLMRPLLADTMIVAELSSFMLEDLHVSPHVVVVTTLFPEHMDHHGTVADYYAAKRRILAFQHAEDVFIYNSRHPVLRSWARESSGRAIPFVSRIPSRARGHALQGKHNEENIRAAVTVAKYFHVSDAAIARGLQEFRPLPHRLERVGTYKGITFYDDAISTTPESTIAALESLSTVRTIFLGGQDRGYNFRKLERALRKSGIQNVVLFPDSGKRILRSRKGFRVLETSSMQDAVRFAYTWTPKGSSCLLSTASPSYSLWKNFEVKGREFQRAVYARGRK